VVASVSGARYQSACDIAVTISLALSADLPHAPNQAVSFKTCTFPLAVGSHSINSVSLPECARSDKRLVLAEEGHNERMDTERKNLDRWINGWYGYNCGPLPDEIQQFLDQDNSDNSEKP
jgi:hypothetical protein